MKNSNNNRRQRNRGGNGRRYPNQRGNSFESNGPEAKVRGSAQQVLDKYQSLARDAFSSGDRILAEGYLQHAEHYYRILNADNANGGRDNNRNQQGRNNNGDDQNNDAQSDENENAGDNAEVAADQSGNEASDEQPKRKPRQRRPKKEVPIEAAEQADAPAEQPSAGD